MAPRDIDVLTGQRDALLEDLAGLGHLRPGTLQPRYRKCGKATRHCAREGDPGHGPKWVPVSRIAGRMRNWTIPDGAVQRTREQLDACRRFRELTRELIAVGDESCQARLEAELPGASEKGGRSGPGSRQGQCRGVPYRGA